MKVVLNTKANQTNLDTNLEAWHQLETVKKTQKAIGPQIAALSVTPVQVKQAEPLTDRVSLEPTLLDKTTLKNLHSLGPKELQAIDSQFVEISKPDYPMIPEDVNFVIKFRYLVAQILDQLRQVSDVERTKNDGTKLKYNNCTAESANLLRKIGNSGFYVSAVGVALMLGQFLFPVQGDRDVMKFLSEQGCPSVGAMFRGRYESTQKQAEALSQLLLAEIQNQGSSQQDKAGSKQEILNILKEVLDTLKSASRSG